MLEIHRGGNPTLERLNMKSLSTKVKTAINREAREVAQRYEVETREQWAKACQTAQDDGENDEALMMRVDALAKGMR
jgi:hypothetical protein